MSASVDPASARGEARRILAGRRYRGAPVPRPLHGILRWIGDRLSPITHWIGDRFSWLPSWAAPWVKVVAAIVVATVIVAFVRYIVMARRRAARLGGDAPAVKGVGSTDDPAALEAAARDAESHGDLALAVRLRFRAGLVRLDRDAHAIDYRPATPTAEVRTQLASPQFDELADTFEAITYGQEPAATGDSEAARRAWPRVITAAKRR